MNGNYAAIGKITFVPNPAGIAALASAPPMVAEMGRRAARVANVAQGIAPVDEGEFRDSIRVEVGIENGRAVGRVLSDDPKARYLEWGTIDTPTFGTLRRALESAG